ncbi:TonB-dependent receptor [Bowmanella yangjiangensis]|uniref:TonB-dependent receptor n=1 Tax=Bowmanella yangjiangensis TaxID=2811230 RepID=A0ABS3CR25_9ALTE|nr:TonB-dependent receptor [Bowmanella yangjiangensis]MBN7819552.1 TonB-dependent receptor [Bowmanella yangjiangensis]
MKTFKPNLITMALLSGGLTLMSLPAMAQQANAEQSAEENVEVIKVSGIRASLQRSQALKMDNTSLVEVITAEDIGKLPDSSIAESIARLPGLAAQRLDGRASSISIRGLGENFSAATFNGREQVSLGDNRGVEFDVYPSEIMNEVMVYKTPDASLMTQGIGGTIDMRTVKPLSFGEQSMSFTLRGEKNDIGKLNPDGEDTGWRGSFSYIDQFNDDTVGLAVAVAHMQSPNNEERFNTWGWPDGVVGGFKPFVRSSELTRDTVMAVLEVAPNDKLKINVDALYIDFEDEQLLRGAEIPAAWGDAGITVTNTVNGLSQSGVIGSADSPVGAVIRNDMNLRKADLTAVGFNAEYALTDLLSLEFDAAYSKVDRKTWSLESYAGSGRGAAFRQPEQIGFTMLNNNQGVNFDPQLDYGSHDVIQLGNPQSWGWGNLTDLESDDDQDGFINTPEVDDELMTLKLAAKRVFEDGIVSSIEFGGYYSDREKSKFDQGLFLTLPQALDANGNVIPGYRMPVPEEYRLPNVSLDFIGFGDMIAYDSFRFWQDGNYTEYDSRLSDPERIKQTWTVKEKVYTAFVKANLETEIGSIPVRGNVGLQVVRTEQESTGGGARRLADRTIDVQPTFGGEEFTEVLPSLNLIFDVADQQLVRFGAARTMSRSRMDRMNASSGELSWNETVGVWSGYIANPQLRPVMADQLDLTYENYFHEEGYFAAAVFYKSLKDWQLEVPSLVDTSDLTPPNGEPVAPLGVMTSWQNLGDGDIQGAEFTLSLSGGMFSDALEGFGGIFSATFLDSSIDFMLDVPTDTSGGMEQREFNITVPGLSDEVYNATLYYENAGFEFRVSWRSRSDFLGEVSGLSLSKVPVQVLGSDLVDAQISYDFSESGIEALYGLTLTLQGQNLTDEAFVTAHTADGNGLDVRDAQVFGRNFMLGLNYKF